MDGQELVKQTLDQIPQANAKAKRIVGLVKEGGRITGYQLSDNTFVEKQQAVTMAKQGQIAGVGIVAQNSHNSTSVPSEALLRQHPAFVEGFHNCLDAFTR